MCSAFQTHQESFQECEASEPSLASIGQKCLVLSKAQVPCKRQWLNAWKVPVTDANISGNYLLLSFTRWLNERSSANSSWGCTELTKLCLFTYLSLYVVLLLTQTSGILNTFTKVSHVFFKHSCTTTKFPNNKWNMFPGSVCVVQSCKICRDVLMHHTWEYPLHSTPIHSVCQIMLLLHLAGYCADEGVKRCILCIVLCFVTGCSCSFLSWQSLC